MFIKEIIIDGFKSYAHRTTVGEFDPLFNAITGLNGSGKSNILDAICFVLGISNLSQVRAGSLQELVYKQGQAGVSKASVTLVFDNADKDQSPLGYAEHDSITITRQVVIGGRNKYLINGHQAQPGRVQNLFHSVQLNVNNPHFLIMQGRITKVLNMKPPEILSMIEEAAGTRMFETKKAAALKTIAKKDSKLDEIKAVIEEEITPTLERLRKERSSYIEYQKVTTEIEHLSRFVTAFVYMDAETKVSHAEQELQQMAATKDQAQAFLSSSRQQVDHMQGNMTIIEKKRQAEKGGVLKDMEAEVAKTSKRLVQMNAQQENMKESIKTEEDRKEVAAKGVAELQAAIAKHQKGMSKKSQLYETKKAEFEQLELALADKERRREAVSLGMSGDQDGENKTFADRLREAENEESAASTEMQQSSMKMDHIGAELKVKKPAAKGSEKEFASMQAKLQILQAEVAKLQTSLEGSAFDEAREGQLEVETAALKKELAQRSDSLERLQARLTNLEFAYADPAPGFDRRKVNGLVAELISVKVSQATAALEITAGSRLFNVVVDTETTGKQLLDKGKLRRRVTIIPLNKIAAHSIRPEAVKRAKQLVGEEKVEVALSLVGFDAEVHKAMEYVFGGTFICPDIPSAEKVTFHKDIRTRSVTYEGEVFDPSGTLTGGSRPNTQPILSQLANLKDQREAVTQLQARLADLEGQLTALRQHKKTHLDLRTKFELKSHELELLNTKVGQSACHQVVAQVAALEEQLEAATAALRAAKARHATAKKQASAIQQEMASFKTDRDSRLKAAEKEVAVTKAKVAQAREAFMAAKEEERSQAHEVEALQAEIQGLQEQMAALDTAIAELRQEEQALETKVDRLKADFVAQTAELNSKKEKLHAYDNELLELARSIDDLTKRRSEAELELKRQDHTLQRLAKDKKDATKLVADLMAEHTWIATERQYFGQPGTVWEFDVQDPAKDPKACRRRLEDLRSVQDKLSKNVNTKAQSMFAKAEREYNDLLKKKKIVQDDKAKIESAIQDLDEKKNEALKKAYVQVNQDFGSIFSTLLPGTNAKLAPADAPDGSGPSVLYGLEVKVAFGQIWKESLTELSGGQRSLVALSLILSLLLFKPAPLYILDEVDAALDLSHTQNIGQMLRTHFNKSQFVVVSLKDGMFNNANVLFKTKFIDGVSTVRRYVQQQPEETLDKENGHGKGASAAVKRGKKPASSRSTKAMAATN